MTVDHRNDYVFANYVPSLNGTTFCVIFLLCLSRYFIKITLKQYLKTSNKNKKVN